MKKTLKRMFSVVMALCMALTLMVPAFAALPTATAYIRDTDGVDSGEVYAIYTSESDSGGQNRILYHTGSGKTDKVTASVSGDELALNGGFAASRQLWTITAVEGGYTVQSVDSGRYLDLSQASTGNFATSAEAVLETAEQLRQAAREAGLLDGIGHEFDAGKVAAELAHAVGELPDDTLTRYIVTVGLGVGRIGELDPVTGRQTPETCIIGRRAHLHGVPCLGLDLQTDTPFGMSLQLVGDEAGLPLDGVVAVDAAVVSVDKPRLRLRRVCGGTDREQQGSNDRPNGDPVPAGTV